MQIKTMLYRSWRGLNRVVRVRCLVLAGWVTLGVPGAVDAGATKLVMQLDLGVQNAQFAGLTWAHEQGWFAAADIDLEIRRLPQGYGDLAANVGASDHTIGSIESGLFLSGRAAGAPIVAIGAMFQASPLGLVAKARHPLRTPHDLVGLKVAVHGDGHEALATVLAHAGVDPATVDVGVADYGDGPLLCDEVDAKQAYYVDEFVRMRVAGHDVNALVYKDWGHLAYSQVMFVSEATLAKHREAIVRFLQVLDRGWKAAAAEPEVAARMVVERYEPELDLVYQLESLKLITAELVWAEDPRTGATSPETWQKHAADFRQNHPAAQLGEMSAWTDFTLIEDAFSIPE